MTFVFTPLDRWVWFCRAAPTVCRIKGWAMGFQIGCVSIGIHRFR